MKLVPSAPKNKTPKQRLVEDVRTELYRLTVLIDELKKDGSIEDLDAAQKVLWGTILILDGRKQK
jgi:hypothetical protein